jgi:hypothetical protein
MTAEELEQVLSGVPPDTPVLFQIEDVEGHCASAVIEYEPFTFTAKRGDLSLVTDEMPIAHITLNITYGPEKVS